MVEVRKKLGSLAADWLRIEATEAPYDGHLDRLVALLASVHAAAREEALEDVDGPYAKLIAAAPALVRALLDAEWAYVDWDEGTVGPQCQGCSDPCFEHTYGRPMKHDDGCAIDAALTLAGLPTPESRDAARGAKP